MTKILGFAGRKQSGKTTCSEFVCRKYNDYIYDILFDNISDKHVSKIYNFADPLKQDICINILGLTYEQCYGNDIAKNSLTNIRWENIPGYQITWTKSKDYDHSGFMTARQVMQHIGTNIFRQIKDDVWSKATINKIKNDSPGLGVIADCRFPNEVDAIKSAGGLVIKLMRDPYKSTHESEIALDINNYDHKNFDLIIHNENISIDDQNEMIYKFLKEKQVIL